MNVPRYSVFRLLVVVALSHLLAGQQQATPAPTIVPRLVNFSGNAAGAQAKIVPGITGITFSIYKEQSGGAPLWMETQNVQVNAKGAYTVQLGSTKPEGLPMELFVSGEARWLGVRVDGEEQPRVLLLSVPYALKAGDAETLGGRPASAYLQAPAPGSNSKASVPAAEQANEIACSSGTACKKFFVPKFASNGGSALVNDSVISQSGSTINIGGPTNVAGNFSSVNVTASGNVGASSVTTNTLSGGVNATMTGTGNSVAAVEGSATATGAAGFTFGVIGQSASDTGRGVFGLGTGAAGVGVIGETTKGGIGVVGKALPGSNGWAFSASGNAQQDRSSGGWAKGLVSVQAAGPPYTIIHCYNSTLPGASATTPPCGFNLIEAAYAQYNIDFGFEVDDRFYAVSAEPFFVDGNNGAIITDAWASAAALGKNSILQVDLYTDGGDYQTTNFTVVVY